ncbi:MAG: GNAT family N-acetyltransferase [bacterium]|nr:GNAT family N-acetyltransferase [bacterium]
MLKLKYLKTTDKENIFRHINNKQILETYPLDDPYTMENVESYIKRGQIGRRKGESHAFSVIYDNQFVGMCALSKIGHWEIYYWIIPQVWNRGIATQVVSKLIGYAKTKFGIAKLCTGVLEENHASRRVLEKNGFIKTDIIINEGKYHLNFKGRRFVMMELET